MKEINLRFDYKPIFVVVIVSGVIMWALFSRDNLKNKKITELSSRDVALMYTTDAATLFHIHPQLKIIVFGKEQLIPTNIGIEQTRMRSLHTHSADGLIHVESPIKKDFTLGDFFAVWGKSFTKEQILDTVLTKDNQTEITVNGTRVDTFDQTIMKDNDKIVIDIK